MIYLLAPEEQPPGTARRRARVRPHIIFALACLASCKARSAKNKTENPQ